MTDDVFNFLLFCASCLYGIATSTTVVDVTIGENHYVLTLFDVAVTFIIFYMAITILCIPLARVYSGVISSMTDDD